MKALLKIFALVAIVCTAGFCLASCSSEEDDGGIVYYSAGMSKSIGDYDESKLISTTYTECLGWSCSYQPTVSESEFEAEVLTACAKAEAILSTKSFTGGTYIYEVTRRGVKDKVIYTKTYGK